MRKLKMFNLKNICRNSTKFKLFYLSCILLSFGHLNVNGYSLDPNQFEIGDTIYELDLENPGNVILRYYFGDDLIVNVPESVVYEGDSYAVTQIGLAAFAQRPCQIINLPNSIIRIAENAFMETFVSEINLPNSLRYLGGWTFWGCQNLKEIKLPNSLETIENGTFTRSALETIEIPESVKRIEDEVFSECESLRSVVIPNSVEFIGRNAFYGCISLSSIKLPDSITTLSTDIFSMCTSLTSIEIPNSVTQIDQHAFDNCISLSSITIPASVRYIFEGAFLDCSSLVTVNSLSIEPPYCQGLGGNFYPECETAVLHVPSGTKEKYAETMGWSDFKNIVDDLSVGDAGIENIVTIVDKEFNIYSIDGKLVSKKLSKKDFGSLPKGTYIIVSGNDRYKISI